MFIAIAAILTDGLGKGSACAVDVRERDLEDSDHPVWGFRAGQSDPEPCQGGRPGRGGGGQVQSQDGPAAGEASSGSVRGAYFV